MQSATSRPKRSVSNTVNTTCSPKTASAAISFAAVPPGSSTSGACRARMRTRRPSTTSVPPSSAVASPSTMEGRRVSLACGDAGTTSVAAAVRTARQVIVVAAAKG